jgi:hypothetical protein
MSHTRPQVGSSGQRHRRPPPFFATVQQRARERWNQLAADPELAGPWHQLFKQVQSPRHVLSELLQNADDAEATTSSARIEEDEFVFEHDGIDFRESHLASLCKFGYSDKRNLHTIGFRGIGFKSTFSLGDEVRLITPSLSVVFYKKRFTEPVWLDDAEPSTTTQVRVLIKDAHRKKELAKNLEEWASSPLSLLFFNSITTLTIEGTCIRRISCGQGPVPGSEWVRLSEEQAQPYLVIRSEEEEFPPDAIEEIRQERMGEDTLQLPPCRVDLVLGSTSHHVLFVVLPTGVDTALPFACNAPFVQDPARVKIKDPEISPTNRWLLQRAGRHAAQAMLAWLQYEGLPQDERAAAYRLFPDVDRQDSSLSGVCSTLCEEAFGAELENTPFLLTQDGQLVAKGCCITLPAPLYDVWTAEQLSSLFDASKRPILSQQVRGEHRQVLAHWGVLDCIEEMFVLDTLESKHLPKPSSWARLLVLWQYVSDKVCTPRYYHTPSRKKVRIFPVQGKDVLFGGFEVVRLGEKKLLSGQDDWEFLSSYLVVLNQNWIRFLAEQRRHAEQHDDKALLADVESAYQVLDTLDMDDASDVTQVVQQVAAKFFAQHECDIDDCVRFAQIAAALGATVPTGFQYVTQNGYRTPVEQQVLADPNSELDLFVDEKWYSSHALDRAYWEGFRSCTESEWRQWTSSERSGLLPFVPIASSRNHVWGRSKLRQIVRERGVESELCFPYVTESFIIDDHDFASEHWNHWRGLAKEDAAFWGRLMAKLLQLPHRHWASALSARAAQIATTGSTRAVTNEGLTPAWVTAFRGLPCLEDTLGRVREPAELLRRTPETEALLDVEPFVKAEYDIEQTRPLLTRLGVRDTPTGPARLLDRLRALARAPSPPVYEVEKWYSRLDHLLVKCTTLELEAVRTALQDESLILTNAGSWGKAGEVFLNANEEDVPGAATIHPGVRHLTLWHRVGVADHPTVDLVMEWLCGLGSGERLSPDQLRRVRSLLPRYAVQIWQVCGHWLNLEGEWAAVENLTYKLTMQALVPWSNLFATTKSKTADLQRLPAELCDQPPFSTLVSLAASIEERIDNGLFQLENSQCKAWLEALGKAIGRISLENEADQARVRDAAIRLTKTVWQPARNLEAVPYIDGTPAGTPRRIDVLWKDHTLYVMDQRVARSFRAIAQELARPFDRQDIADAIKACVERSPDFIVDYMEQNFALLPERVEAESEEQPSGTEESSAQPPQDQPTSPLAGDQETIDTSPTETEQPTEGGPDDSGMLVSDESGVEPPQPEPIVRIHTPRPAKPRFIEIFAKTRGYQPDGELDRFFHADGSWLQKADGGVFPWERYTADGHLAQSYWLKEHCLQEEPLEVGADVWQLCQDHPGAYTLVLADLEGCPLELTGERLQQLRVAGQLKLYPAGYRLAYEDGGT